MPCRAIVFLCIGLGLLGGCARQPSSAASAPPASATPPPAATLIEVVFNSPVVAQAYGTWPVLTPFAHTPGRAACNLPQWHPPMADGSDFTSIPGMCETMVQPDGAAWVVRLRETWDPALFRLASEQAASDFEHTWAFTVDANQQVVHWEHKGNFPPQFVHTDFK